MKTERRHELETNTLAAALATSVERVKPYSKALVGGAVAVALVVGVYILLSARTRSQAAEGWDQYFEAVREGGLEGLIDVAEEYRGTPAGSWSRLRVADFQFFRGSSLLFQDRGQANDQLSRAVENYQAVLDQADADMLQQRARYGLAQAYESLNELDKARASYHALADVYPDSALRLLADRRLEDLKKQSTRKFYDWFASQDPGPAFETEPGEMPEFNFDSLPDPPDDQSTGIFDFDASGSPPSTTASQGGESPAADSADTPAGSEEPSSEQPPSEGTSPDDAPPSVEDSSASEASGPSLKPATGQAQSRPDDQSSP